jgi:hypothetical protein
VVEPGAGSPDSSDPIIVMGYPHSGAALIQQLLSAGTTLACTQGTGIIPLCAVAAETWQRLEGQPGRQASPLAVASVRRLVTTQVTTLLAVGGQGRWCELATVSPDAAVPFLQVFPGASFICVHRSSTSVIRAGVQASPWGLQGQIARSYLMSYPGNSVAALAAHWADATQSLLAFEAANPQSSHRVRYEDVVADPDHALAPVRTSLALRRAAGDGAPGGPGGPGQPQSQSPDHDPQAAADDKVPAEMIPAPLLDSIGALHAELGYPPPGA